VKKYGVNTPYDEGYKAFEGRRGLKDNPYPLGSSDNQNWKDGWWEASKARTTSGRITPE
jgi:hypothetical protein